ncbi:transglycosylase SLT domain-containing protein [candidate division KSB1 bacterium]
MDDKNCIFLYFKGRVKKLCIKNLYKKLAIYTAATAVVAVFSSVLINHSEIKSLKKEVAQLAEEFEVKEKKYLALSENFNMLESKYFELFNVSSIISSVNPYLAKEDVRLWVNTLRDFEKDIYKNLNNSTLMKLETEFTRESVNPGFSLMLAIAAQESDFRLESSSKKGAYGPMQLKQITAEHIGVSDFKDPKENIGGGARYFIDLLKKYYKYPDQLELALASYNAGRTRVSAEWIPSWGSRWQSIHTGLIDSGGRFKETRNYVNSIMALSHLFVSGKWNFQTQYFWTNYKSYLRNFDIAFLYNYAEDAEGFIPNPK